MNYFYSNSKTMSTISLFDLDTASVISNVKNHGNYDQEFKKTVIIAAEKTSNREAEKMYGVSESNIRRWRKLKGEIFGFEPSTTQMKAKKIGQPIKRKVQKMHFGKEYQNFVVRELKSIRKQPTTRKSGTVFNALACTLRMRRCKPFSKIISAIYCYGLSEVRAATVPTKAGYQPVIRPF